MKIKMYGTENKENKILGMRFLHNKNNTVHYGMCAMYVEDYSEDHSVVKVNVTKPNGKEEYCININDVSFKRKRDRAERMYSAAFIGSVK